MKRIEVVAAIIRKGDKIFATQRGYGEWKDWWEFPGGKIEAGERPEEALVREIREELSTEISVDEYLCTVEYDYPKFHLAMHCYLCSLLKKALHLNEHEAARWLSKDELDTVKWLPADVQVVKEITHNITINRENMTKFELMALPYAPEALEPVISRETLAFHHGKHLAAYVNNLNVLLPGSGFEKASLEDIVCGASGGILNNAGQILNHELYFGQFTAPKEGNAPEGKLAEAIARDFGSFEAFKDTFQKAGATLFGSGWVWLSADKDGKLVITQEPNAANPVQKGLKPLLTFDVWEHAYYLDYQNRRPDHLAALWQIIDWNVIEQRNQGR